MNFAENKLAPVPSFGVDWLKNENFAGDKFDPLKEGGRMMLPLGAENAYEGFKASPGAGAVSVGLGGIGFGVQTYKAKPGRDEKAYRAELKDIDAAVRRGELDEEAGEEFKRLAEEDYETKLRSKQLRKRGLKDDALDRQLLIDASIKAEDDLPTINEFLAQAGLGPVSAEEIAKAERELFKLDVQVGR
jgi:hypothetical protein